MIILIENQILPPIAVYREFLKSEKVIIEKFDNYQKRTFRNRFMIMTSKGIQTVSIPLQKGKNSSLFTDVKIAYDMDWLRTLSATFRTNYGSAPFFEHYFDSLMDIFYSRFNFLYDLNIRLHDFINTAMEIDIKYEFSQFYKGKFDKGNDLRNKYLPYNFNEELFTKNLIMYNQVFIEKTGFVPNLSILDLLFNRGKYGQNILLDQPSK